MIKYFGTALRVTIVFVILFGFIYPFGMTGLSQLLFPRQANGSLVEVNGKIVGSDIIGQRWSKPQYFHGRPSAAGTNGYDPTATGGTNLGPSSKKLIDATREAIKALKKENPRAGAPPIELVTSSASGIDPDISPAAAYYHARRGAGARHLSRKHLRALIARHIERRELGFLGEPRINVSALNIALDAHR